MESESAKHGFESVLVMCGSVMNEDASLGFMHTTGGATKVSISFRFYSTFSNPLDSFSRPGVVQAPIR